MNVTTHSFKKRLPFLFLIGMGLLLLSPGFSLADQSHEQVKADMAKTTKITIEQAIQTATKEVPGTVIKAELEKEHGPLTWEIEIVTSDGKVQEVHLDGTNGKRLALQAGEGSKSNSDAAIHAGSADTEKKKMEKPAAKKPAAEKSETAESSMKKKP